MINRRGLLQSALAAAAILSIQTGVRAQARPKRFGFLWNGQRVDPVLAQRVAAFKAGMRDLGYAEGRDYVIEQRFAENDLPRLTPLAAELVAAKVDAIVTGGNATVRAARGATRDIPILTTVSSDIVAAGFVASLSRPGGNVTGFSSFTNELYPKRMELLREAVPTMRRMGVLYDAQSEKGPRALQPFARKLELEAIPVSVKSSDVEATFKKLQGAQAQGLIVFQSGTTIALKESITRHAAVYRLPAMYPLSVFTEAGGLLSYSEEVLDVYRRLAVYVDKILKGARPGDLPIEQPTKFELVVNMNAAKALGITIPQSVLLQASRVIE